MTRPVTAEWLEIEPARAEWFASNPNGTREDYWAWRRANRLSKDGECSGGRQGGLRRSRGSNSEVGMKRRAFLVSTVDATTALLPVWARAEEFNWGAGETAPIILNERECELLEAGLDALLIKGNETPVTDIAAHETRVSELCNLINRLPLRAGRGEYVVLTQEMMERHAIAAKGAE